MKNITIIIRVIFITLLLVIQSCSKEKEETPVQYFNVPELTTNFITTLTDTSSVSGGNITSDGGSEIIERGVCWNINPNPTTSNYKTSDGSGKGAFTSTIKVLLPRTTYYVRAYAINSVGTGYGNELSFTTKEDTSITFTYIGGAGFLLESGTKRILIDGVFTANGVSGFITPSANVITDIGNSSGGFSNIDLYLVGHAHGDHFDPAMMDRIMVSNTNTKLVCPQEAADDLTGLAGNHFSSYSNRVYIPKLNKFESSDTAFNSIKIKITKFPPFGYHPNGIIVFNVTLGNMNILHLLGPSFAADVYTNKFNDLSNDILLTGSDYLSPSTNIIENSLNYKVSYVSHIYNYKSVLNSYINISNQLKAKGHPVIILSGSMEKHKISKSNGTIKIDQ